MISSALIVASFILFLVEFFEVAKTYVGGLLLGIIEAFSVSVVPLAFQDAISITILLFILFVKPHGIFGSSEAARLKDF